jgi:hypothetical protein
LQPNVPADPNELKPNVSDSDKTLPPPPQVNEIQPGAPDQAAASSSSTPSSDSAAGQEQVDDATISSSKHKKKKGLKKIVPF